MEKGKKYKPAIYFNLAILVLQIIEPLGNIEIL